MSLWQLIHLDTAHNVRFIMYRSAWICHKIIVVTTGGGRGGGGTLYSWFHDCMYIYINWRKVWVHSNQDYSNYYISYYDWEERIKNNTKNKFAGQNGQYNEWKKTSYDWFKFFVDDRSSSESFYKAVFVLLFQLSLFHCSIKICTNMYILI